MNKYSEFIRILGRGPTKSRHLTREEAREAFAGALSGDMADLQIGALLLLLRYRSEDAAELAGIVEAIRDSLEMAAITEYQDLIDWPSYSAGKSRGLPWFLLAAKLLAENGHKVFMHGYNSHLENGIPTEDCLAAIDEGACINLAEASEKLSLDNFAFLPLRNFCPRILEFLQMRNLLGVRSIINTAVRLINPLHADTLFLGIFHPPYINLNREAALLLEQPRLGVIKGGGGEAERTPFKPISLFTVIDGTEEKSSWPASLKEHEQTDRIVSLDHFRDVWYGKAEDSVAFRTILGTAAQALYLKGVARDVPEAEVLARTYWEKHLSS
ncbi:glycosyl transferase family protein [Emcibacter nanhaiensis]|uniref:Glycosyl transferase family protein n=1 Tax=Emcibacter nanhaiensis TaxID=1505037 RepID=A0A501PAY9_9PROT|nr:glycosyl transferase family protein [Emcibacter nanhaiensis]TPD57523.1 glycosyl transferase family protein [Emcibacter nanhaiensis]